MRRSIAPRFRSQAGDTIVEVLIVLAVLGLAFTISYSTATRALSQSRNAQEHSEALGVLNAQVELLRTALAKHVTLPVNSTPPPGNSSRSFCLSDANDPPTVVGFGSYNVPNNPANDTAITNTPPLPVYPAACIQGFYRLSIIYDIPSGAYDLRVRWDGPNSTGRQQEQFNYKITPVAAAFGGAGYIGSPPLQSPTLQARVQKIQKNSNNTAPSCASANPRVNLSGATVSLSPGGQSGVTNGSGLTSIIDLVEGQTYSATIAGTDYTFCSSTSQQAKTTTPYNRVEVVVAAKCTTIPASTGPPYHHYTTQYQWVHTGPDAYRDWRNMPPVQGWPPAVFQQYEYSGGLNIPGPVYLTSYNLAWILTPPAWADVYAFYTRWEYRPFSVYLGYYGDPIPAHNVCN